MSTIRELGPEETHLADRALRELHPNLDALQAFVSRGSHDQRPEGYRLVAACDEPSAERAKREEREAAVAAVGFRPAHHLLYGFYRYSDDLLTCEAYRGRGHGSCLMQWVLNEARRLGCDEPHRTSGPQRQDVHHV